MELTRPLMMELTRPVMFMVYSLLFLAFVAVSSAHIGVLDEYWQKRADESRAMARSAYNPDPQSVTNSFNKAVHGAMEGNTTRRSLRANRLGECAATNPIDRCWRCRPNWIRNRKRLASCAKGFGRKTTGGKNGAYYVVTESTDNDLVNPQPGTLRYGVIQDRPLWIVFARDMVIRLNEELIINSNKTIDGRGANVHIAFGGGLTIQFVHNVIVHSLHIHDIKAGNGGLIRDSETHYGLRTKSDGDGISIYGSTNVWIDHVSMSNCMDGLIDAVQGSTAITISNSHFTKHNEVMLFGASDSYSQDALMQITVAFNHFGRGLVQRMPRCRWGFVHVVNNDYTHWLMYAIGGSQHPTIISQGNRYTAPINPDAKEVTKRDYSPQEVWSQWTWRSEGDLMLNGAFFVQGGSPFVSHYSEKDFIKSKPGTFVTRLTRFSGALNCRARFLC